MRLDRLHHCCADSRISTLGFGIHRNQHALLIFLSKHGKTASQKEIAAFFDISPAAVANSLKVLENAGYIKRTADSSDSRRNMVEITEKGSRVIELSRNELEKIDNIMIEGLSDEELAVFERCVEKMEENLKKTVGTEENK